MKMDAKKAAILLQSLIHETEYGHCVISDYMDSLKQIANLLNKSKIKRIPVKEQKPQVGKTVLLSCLYQYGEFPDSAKYIVGYLDKNGRFKPDIEGLEIPTYADVYLSFDPAHWADIDSPSAD